jgi:heme/copper-type cytochrome/quinol oxidase subunit 2
MNPLSWSLLGLLIAMLVYWAVAISWWLVRRRQNARAAEPASLTHVSETEIVVSFEERINVVRAVVVLLAPPSLLLLVWLIGRN